MKLFSAILSIFFIGCHAALRKPRVLPDCSQVKNNELVYFPHPTNCSKFFQCAFQVPVEMVCPKELEWNYQRNQCDFPELANCSLSSKSWKLNKCENISEFQNVLLPNPEDCTTYFHCVHQNSVLEHCPEEMHFSLKSNRCEYPQNAGCQKAPRFAGCENIPETQIVLLPNPKNCSTYIQCVHQKPVIRECPPGLKFSKELNRCTWPSEANCKEEESCEDVQDWEDVFFPNPENCGSYIQCVHQKPVVRNCPEGLHWSIERKRCEWSEIANCSVSLKSWKLNNCENVSDFQNVLVPNPEDCTTYFHCVHQTPVLEHCPEGLNFSPKTNRCEYPRNAGCLKIPRMIECENVPENQIVLLPNPKNCSTYIQCIYQKPKVRNCPPGLKFSEELKTCTWPSQANCQEEGFCVGVKDWDDVVLPNPEDCGSYIQCVHQKPIVRNCPGGLHWSSEVNRCESPKLANCQVFPS